MKTIIFEGHCCRVTLNRFNDLLLIDTRTNKTLIYASIKSPELASNEFIINFRDDATALQGILLNSGLINPSLRTILQGTRSVTVHTLNSEVASQFGILVAQKSLSHKTELQKLHSLPWFCECQAFGA